MFSYRVLQFASAGGSVRHLLVTADLGDRARFMLMIGG
jgi:hypothetical protein